MDSFARAYIKAISFQILPVIWAVMSVFGIVSGAFGTWQMTTWERVLYWPMIVGVGILIGAGLRVLVREQLGLRNYFVEAPVIAAFAALSLTPMCVAVAHWVAEGTQKVPHWRAVAGYIAVVSLTITTLRHAVARTLPLPVLLLPERGGLAPHDDHDAGPAEPLPRLLARLEPALRAPLVRLQMRNHYVDVVTEKGSQSLLMRLADAISETEGVEGLQVHRSHWVARAAMLGVQRGAGKMALRMADGALVPVSRPYQGVVILLDLPALTPPPPEAHPKAGVEG